MLCTPRRRSSQACDVLPCMLQIIPEQGITPLFNHLNSSTSWFPALGKVRHSPTPLSVEYHLTRHMAVALTFQLRILSAATLRFDLRFTRSQPICAICMPCSTAHHSPIRHGVQIAWVYTLFMATIMGLLVGVTQRILGSPGDLPEVVHQIHTSGRIAISQAPSMFVCSAFSIAAGTHPLSKPDSALRMTRIILRALSAPGRPCDFQAPV